MLSRLQQRIVARCLLIVAALAFALISAGNTGSASGQVLDSTADRFKKQLKAKKPVKPYGISSRIVLAKDTNEGYLVVQVTLQKGSHIYSLTQGGNVPPTKLTLSPSKQLRLTGAFTPESPAKVIPMDPSLGQRVEKHSGTVQFFAPIQLAPNVDLTKLAVEVQFDGQVCTNDSCVPVRRHKTQSKFAGFFAQPSNKEKASSVASKPGNSGGWPLNK